MLRAYQKISITWDLVRSASHLMRNRVLSNLNLADHIGMTQPYVIVDSIWAGVNSLAYVYLPL